MPLDPGWELLSPSLDRERLRASRSWDPARVAAWAAATSSRMIWWSWADCWAASSLVVRWKKGSLAIDLIMLRMWLALRDWDPPSPAGPRERARDSDRLSRMARSSWAASVEACAPRTWDRMASRWSFCWWFGSREAEREVTGEKNGSLGVEDRPVRSSLREQNQES